jgi:hypothetical protein
MDDSSDHAGRSVQVNPHFFQSHIPTAARIAARKPGLAPLESMGWVDVCILQSTVGQESRKDAVQQNQRQQNGKQTSFFLDPFFAGPLAFGSRLRRLVDLLRLLVFARCSPLFLVLMLLEVHPGRG